MKRRVLLIIATFLVIYNSVPPIQWVNAQGSPEEEARALLARLIP